LVLNLALLQAAGLEMPMHAACRPIQLWSCRRKKKTVAVADMFCYPACCMQANTAMVVQAQKEDYMQHTYPLPPQTKSGEAAITDHHPA
jgi:hypothetical protein